jgi:hypothetical protein
MMKKLSHPSIKDQGTIEEQRYEESLDIRVIQEPTLPPPYERTNSTYYTHF